VPDDPSPGGVPARTVDTHVHVWPRGLIHPAQRRREPMEATPADLVATLDASGVDRAIVTPAMVHPDNGYVLGAAATLPHRIGAVAGIDPRTPGAVASIEGLVGDGALGVRVNLGATSLDAPDELAGLDTLVAAAVGSDLVIQWTIRLSSAGLIERAAARAPGARQVIDHLGLPADATDLDALDRIRALAAIPGVHVKLSGMYALSQKGYPYEDTWPWAEGVVDAFGAERIMWASDWPLAGESASHADHLALVGRLPFLDGPARRRILGETAEGFWRL
jgi:predicted TIM-barrel fold metal-dependent hydrolase